MFYSAETSIDEASLSESGHPRIVEVRRIRRAPNQLTVSYRLVE